MKCTKFVWQSSSSLENQSSNSLNALASDFNWSNFLHHEITRRLVDSFEENSRLYLTFIYFGRSLLSRRKRIRRNSDEGSWRLSSIEIFISLFAWLGSIHIVSRTKEGTLRKETEWKRTNGRDPIDPFSSNFRIHPGSSTNQQVRRPLIRDCLNYPEGNRRDDLQIFNNACYAKIPRTVGVKAFPCARNISRREE